MVARPGRYLKVLVVVEVPMLSALSSFESLIVILLVYALVLHLLHAVVKSEVTLSIPSTHWNYSMNDVVAWHVLVIVWTHVLATLSIDVAVEVSLILAI